MCRSQRYSKFSGISEKRVDFNEMAHLSGYDRKCSFTWKKYNTASAKLLVTGFLTSVGLVEEK